MKNTIEAKEQELKRIFSDDYLFQIPAYQRPYAWTTEQAAELLDDLMIGMGVDKPMEDVSPYFLGSIVLIKDPTLPSAQVVDGQQRLTTLTILFCVLRDLSDVSHDRNSLHKYVCEQGDPFAGTQDRYRLNLRDRDQLFFVKNVQSMGMAASLLERSPDEFSDSQKRIYENTKLLWDRLSQTDSGKRIRLARFLVQRCYLVVVAASDQDSAYRVFSVMNDRGLDLSPTDILKADIIGSLPETIRPDYTDQWEDIEEELGRDGFSDLFSHIRMIYLKGKARGSLSQEFREGVLRKVNGTAFIDTVLRPLAEAYQVVVKAAYSSVGGAEKVNTYLEHLGRLDNYDWVPPAIAYFQKWKSDHQALIAFTQGLERLAYALFVLRANVNERINRYADVLRAIETDSDLQSVAAPLQLTPEEKSAVVRALGGPIYLQTRVRMPLLLRLDGLLADHGVSYDHRVLSIEHVLPQTPPPGSIWLSWFPNAQEREDWTHRLANLVLLSRQKNAQARNFDFDRKKREYFRRKGVSTFAITSQVLNEEEWTVPVIERRQAMLIETLSTEWRLN